MKSEHCSKCVFRYESLKAEEAAEMQSALEAKYGVVQRKRVPLMVNDTVILYFKVCLGS